MAARRPLSILALPLAKKTPPLVYFHAIHPTELQKSGEISYVNKAVC